jgi:hypothetical protein
LNGFSRAMIFATFKHSGKWPSLRQWLNKYIECARGLLGKCWRHPFEMSLKPQDFPHFRVVFLLRYHMVGN